MLIKSNKPSYNLPPLKNIVDDIEANIVYDDNEKCDLFNKYFSCISGIDDENVLLPYPTLNLEQVVLYATSFVQRKKYLTLLRI